MNMKVGRCTRSKTHNNAVHGIYMQSIVQVRLILLCCISLDAVDALVLSNKSLQIMIGSRGPISPCEGPQGSEMGGLRVGPHS